MVLIPYCISVVGTASYGFIINDISDIKSDKQAGKKNFASKYNPYMLGIFVVISILMGFIPWLFLPVSPIAFGFFFLQMVLLTLYALPPVRIKNTVFAGVFVDALYSSLIPALITIFVFAYDVMHDSVFRYILVVLSVTYFLRGIRNILLHQLSDARNDAKSNITTFVTKYGKKSSLKLLTSVYIIEMVALVAFVVLLSLQLKYFWGIVPVIFLYYFFKINSKYTRPKSKMDYLLYLNDFYEDVLPVVLLILLCLVNPWYSIVFVIHVMVFQNKLIWNMLIVWLYYKIFHNKYAKQFYGLFKK